MKYIYCYTNTKNGKNMLDKQITQRRTRDERWRYRLASDVRNGMLS